MDRIRTPFLIFALILIILVVLVEVGSLLLPSAPLDPNAAVNGLTPPASDPAAALRAINSDRGAIQPPPGLGIPYMALIDATLLVTVALISSSFIIGRNLEGRIQGCVTLIFSLVVVIGGIVMIFVAFQLVLFMIALLLSVPFGTLAYLAIYGFFDRGGAGVVLSLLMIMKIAFAVCLVLAQQRFLQAKGLVVLVILSLVANIIVAFLQGLPPGFLVSITDAIAAIVVGIIGVVVAIVLLIFAIVSVLKALAAPAGGKASS
jgi:hypothetical protein